MEFRLYYDEMGRVKFYLYTDAVLEGEYIVVSKEVFAEGRSDIWVIDREIKSLNSAIITKLVPSTIGTKCSVDDVSVIVDSEEHQYWEITTHEVKYY